jgi:hypothetical protein
MLRFTLAILVIIATLSGTWSVLDRRWFIAVLYYAVAVGFYIRLERAMNL